MCNHQLEKIRVFGKGWTMGESHEISWVGQVRIHVVFEYGFHGRLGEYGHESLFCEGSIEYHDLFNLFLIH